MLAADDTWLQTFVEPGAGATAPCGVSIDHPVARGDATLGGGVRMQFDFRVAGALAQAGQGAVLALAELAALGAGQDQRVALGEIRPGEWADQRLLEVRQRRVAVIEEGLGVELDLTRRRGEAGGTPSVSSAYLW